MRHYILILVIVFTTSVDLRAAPVPARTRLSITLDGAVIAGDPLPVYIAVENPTSEAFKMKCRLDDDDAEEMRIELRPQGGDDSFKRYLKHRGCGVCFPYMVRPRTVQRGLILIEPSKDILDHPGEWTLRVQLRASIQPDAEVLLSSHTQVTVATRGEGHSSPDWPAMRATIAAIGGAKTHRQAAAAADEIDRLGKGLPPITADWLHLEAAMGYTYHLDLDRIRRFADRVTTPSQNKATIEGELRMHTAHRVKEPQWYPRYRE